MQQTIAFDSLGRPLAPTTWYEALEYPDHFRIDVGDPSLGRAVIYRNDSSYFFKEGKLVRATAEPMEFLLLEGALKCYSVDEVLGRMRLMGYDLGALHRTSFQGEPVYVIGAPSGDLQSKQIWIEQRRLIPIRRLDPQPGGGVLEVVYGGFQLLKRKWVETEVTFFLDGHRLQQEIYSELDGNPRLKASLFDPRDFGAWHWKR